MQGWQILSIITASFVLLVVIDMMRRRKLREKYAGVWLVLASGMVVLAVLPEGGTQAVARAAGIQTRRTSSSCSPVSCLPWSACT